MREYSWPALKNWNGEWPSFCTSRAVFGKVHRAPTEYRWIAWSQGLDPRACALEQELGLGPQEDLSSVLCWRSRTSAGCPMAVRYYPSRAIDASGRQADAERQILAPLDLMARSLPAAALAFLLLPRASEDLLNDSVWWDSYRDSRWTDWDFFLNIAPEQSPLIAPGQNGTGFGGDLRPLIHQGIRELFEALGMSQQQLSVDGAERLKNFYALILAQAGAPSLRIAVDALSPLAMAALLLPFERERADQLRLAGGLLSQRFAPERLGDHWDGVICGPQMRASEAPTEVIPYQFLDEAERMVQMLRDGLTFGGDPQPASSDAGRLFWNLLRSKECYLSPCLFEISKAAPGHFQIITNVLERAELQQGLTDFIYKVNMPPPGSDEHTVRHEKVKAELLLALFLVFCPGSEAARLAQSFPSKVVPYLFLMDMLDPEQRKQLILDYDGVDPRIFGWLVKRSLETKESMVAVSRVGKLIAAMPEVAHLLHLETPAVQRNYYPSSL